MERGEMTGWGDLSVRRGETVTPPRHATFSVPKTHVTRLHAPHDERARASKSRALLIISTQSIVAIVKVITAEDFVWFTLGEEKPLLAFAGTWTESMGDCGVRRG